MSQSDWKSPPIPIPSSDSEEEDAYYDPLKTHLIFSPNKTPVPHTPHTKRDLKRIHPFMEIQQYILKRDTIGKRGYKPNCGEMLLRKDFEEMKGANVTLCMFRAESIKKHTYKWAERLNPVDPDKLKGKLLGVIANMSESDRAKRFRKPVQCLWPSSYLKFCNDYNDDIFSENEKCVPN